MNWVNVRKKCFIICWRGLSLSYTNLFRHVPRVNKVEIGALQAPSTPGLCVDDIHSCSLLCLCARGDLLRVLECSFQTYRYTVRINRTILALSFVWRYWGFNDSRGGAVSRRMNGKKYFLHFRRCFCFEMEGLLELYTHRLHKVELVIGLSEWEAVFSFLAEWLSIKIFFK